ncbi:hypothetical protein PENNAL_c0161G04474 [Penicillium nalgiovense]|uniref:Uncharacterized protein n=1 Tax=Penicillium nalgiovense TaxID=60175 RepID=A0A1V6WY09_PENNA|nr:hypothetical protein PENNAL_c0161G04474 [Penicillium nalgiovense]
MAAIGQGGLGGGSPLLIIQEVWRIEADYEEPDDDPHYFARVLDVASIVVAQMFCDKLYSHKKMPQEENQSAKNDEAPGRDDRIVAKAVSGQVRAVPLENSDIEKRIN